SEWAGLITKMAEQQAQGRLLSGHDVARLKKLVNPPPVKSEPQPAEGEAPPAREDPGPRAAPPEEPAPPPPSQPAPPPPRRPGGEEDRPPSWLGRQVGKLANAFLEDLEDPEGGESFRNALRDFLRLRPQGGASSEGFDVGPAWNEALERLAERLPDASWTGRVGSFFRDLRTALPS